MYLITSGMSVGGVDNHMIRMVNAGVVISKAVLGRISVHHSGGGDLVTKINKKIQKGTQSHGDSLYFSPEFGFLG